MLSDQWSRCATFLILCHQEHLSLHRHVLLMGWFLHLWVAVCGFCLFFCTDHCLERAATRGATPTLEVIIGHWLQINKLAKPALVIRHSLETLKRNLLNSLILSTKTYVTPRILGIFWKSPGIYWGAANRENLKRKSTGGISKEDFLEGSGQSSLTERGVQSVTHYAHQLHYYLCWCWSTRSVS